MVINEASAVKTISLYNYQLTPITISPLSVSAPYVITGGTCVSTLAASSNCTILLTLSPTALGAVPATSLTVSTNAPNTPLTAALTGTGIPPVELSPTSLSFGTQYEGTTSAVKTVTLTNEQNVPLNISSVTIGGTNSSDFGVTSSCPTVPASVLATAHCSLFVTFAPTGTGTRTATLSVADDALFSPQTLTLTGSGNAPVTVTPASIVNFSAPVGTTSSYQTITIKNSNVSQAVNIFSFQLGGDFKQTSTTCGAALPYTLIAGASCNVTMSFAPTIGGTRDGQLQVYDNAVTSPQVVNLSGTGTSPLTISPASLTFSAQKVGTLSPPKNITLTNHEVQPETFTLTTAGNFTATSNCASGTIAANSACIISVVFAPSATATLGALAGSLSIADSAAIGSPLTAVLTGSASATNPAAAVAVVAPGAGAAGTSVPVVITGNGWTHFSASSVISFVETTSKSTSCGLTVTGQTLVSANQINATLVLGSGSSEVYGACNLSVVTPLTGGGNETAQLTSAFIIADPSNAHMITAVTPAFGIQGQTLDVDLASTGTNFVQGTTYANFGDGVTVNYLSITDATDAQANITISNTTPVGYRTITMVTGGEFATSSSTAFQIGPNSATLLSVSPNSAGQGTSVPVTLTASGTHFLQSATQASFTGGIVVASVQVTSPTTAVAQLAVPANAASGLQNAMVSTGGEIATLQNAFGVFATTPVLTSVSPSSGQQGQTLNVEIQGFNTNFSQGAIVADFTGEIAVNSIIVNSATDVLVNITISQNANAGSITANLTSGPSGSATVFPFTFTVTASSASIVSVTPNSVPQGGQVTLAVVGSNTNWVQGTTTAGFYPVPVPEPGVDEVTINSPTSASLNIAVPTNTPPGTYEFYLATGGQVVNASVTVYAYAPTLTMSPANGVAPTGTASNSFSVSFTGQFTHFNQSATLPVVGGEGVTLSNFKVTSLVSATGTITIAPAAPVDSRKITLTTGGEIVSTYFNVGGASIFSIWPDDSPHNNTLDVAITGVNTHFNSATTTVLFGPQITENSVTVFDATHLTANITTSYLVGGVSTSSPVGWQQVYVNTGAEQVISSFLVDPPSVLSVDPQSAAQGSTVDVTITGSSTNWGSTTEAILGAGVTVANLTVTSPTTATATISVSPTAPVGGNSVVMITGSEIESNFAFSVTPGAAEIVSVLPPGCSAVNSALTCNGVAVPAATLPWQVMQLQTTTLNLVGLGTHWLQGETSVSFGPNVSVDSLTVTSPTTATVQITVLSGSPVGYAALTTSTDGEVVTLQQAIDIEQGFPTLLATTPGGAEQGNILNLQVLGRFTHWQQGVTTAAFNRDITVNSFTVIDNESAIANITVSPLAYIDTPWCLPVTPSSHTITITTDSEQVSLPGTFCVTQGPAEITSVSPASGLQGSTETVTVTGSATHFEQGVTTANFGSGVNVSNVTVTGPTSATVALGITTTAPSGFQTVTMTTLGEVASQQYGFTVGPAVAELTEAIPNQAEQGVQNLTVQLIGQYSNFSALSTATFGAGITVNSVAYVSSTEVDASISIDPLSYAGLRLVTVTTPQVPCAILAGTPNACPPGSPGGSTGSEIVSNNAFTIIPGPAIISQVAPATGNQGQEVVFTVSGSATHWAQNFTQFWIPGAGSDLTINSVIINSPTSATVDMNISPTANPNPRSIFMVTAGEALADRGAFVITGGIPVVTYLNPNNATPGTNQLEVVINGLFTKWDSTSTVNFGPGITVTSFQVDDNTHIEALINIDPAAQLGYRTVQVQTGTQILTGNFQVAAPAPPPTPYIWYYWPTSGLPGQTFTISFNGQNTHWDPTPVTGTQVSFGSGIQVNTFQVTSPTTALANITITATTAQSNLIVFTTASETETVGFNVVVAQPTLSIVDPGSGMQGAQGLTVNIIGQYTTFDSTTTFAFGSGVTVNGPPTILGPTIATQSVSVNQLAPLGISNVTATTPDAIGSAQVVGGAAFTVTPSLALIAAIAPNTALQGSTITVEVTGQNTHWDSATTFQFGAGIVVTNTTVNSNTDATLTLTIPALAAEGPGNVTAQTAGEVATITNGFVVQPGTPLLLSSGPVSLPQQSSAIFTILSQATQWSAANPPTVSYGPGIVLTNVSVTGPTSMTVDGYVQPTTNVGWRNLTVTTGTQVLGIQNAVYVSSGPAAINSVLPSTGGQGVNLPAVQINGTNTNWVQGVTQLNFPGVLINSFTVDSANSITANITVSDYAHAGQVSVTATTGGEVATGSNVFTITQTQPELLAVVASSGYQGQTENVNITGEFTHFVQGTTTANFGAGITINGVTVMSATTAMANITVQPTANVGYRNVSITTGNEIVSLNNGFNVTVGPAAIASLSPASGSQDTTQTVVVTGSQTNFANGTTTAAFGGGISVTGVSVTDALRATVTISIPNSVPVGQYNVTLTTGGEVATILGGFGVTAGNPIISAVNPPTGHQGDTNLSVSLTGLNSHFVNGTSTAIFGAGITVNALTVSDSTDAVATITIDPAAAIGSRNVTVTTGSEVATLTGGFSVLAGQPQLVSAAPGSAQAGTTVNVVITGEFTTFQQGFSTVTFASGITVNSVAVASITQLTANITLASNAPVGSSNVTVTTNGQTETLINGFTVTPGTPAISQINPNIGSPGQTVTVTINGQYTNWGATTTASFGPAISVGGAAEGAPGPVTVTNATTLTASLTIDPNAAFGPVDVILTTGSEIENVAAGFTIQPAVVSPPTVVSVSPAAFNGGMPTNSNIIVVFSQPMMRSTINTSNVLLYLTSNPNQGNIAVPGTVTLDASGLVMTFTPSALLAVNSQYSLQLTNGIQDASGNTFSYSQWPYNGYYYFGLSTTFTANTTTPTVVAANPLSNSNVVGTNASIQLEFSTEMDEATQAGLTVSTGGTNVAGSWSWNSNIINYYYWEDSGPGNIVTFTPTSPLAANTTYTVSYGAPLADTAGNALTPGSFTFTTGSGADTINDSAAVGLSYFQSNLGTNFAPKVTFSKPVNPIDINTGTLFLYNYDSGKYLKGAVNVAANGLSATFTPSLPLLPNTAYTLYMSSGYYDMDGNYLYGTYGYFTTGAGTELTPPTVASIFPANATTSVPLNFQVVAHFSEAIDPTSSYSITVTPAGGSPIAGTATLASDQVTLTFSPTASLLGNTVYTVQVSGYADLAGNAGATFTSAFTTATSVAPLNLSTGLDASGNLITTGDTPDANWVVVPNGSTTPQPLLVMGPGNADFYPYMPANGPLSSWVTIDPDLNTGNSLGTYSTTFNLTGYSLNNLCFDGAMGVYGEGTLLLNGTPITGAISALYSLAPLSITLPQSALNAGSNTLSLQWNLTGYNWEGFRLQGMIETCGASLSSGLSVVGTTPASGATSVPTNTTITINFNNPIDPATVNASTLPVMIGWNGSAGIAGSYQVSGNTVTFTPDSPFPVNTLIYLGNCNGPYDTAGESIPGCYSYQLASFTTASTATPVTPTPPPFQVMAFTPAANATNVGLRAPVVATFNRSVNPYTINQTAATSDFALFNGDSQSPWCQSYSRSQDNSTVQFTCYPLPYNSTMTAMLNSNIQDFAGDALPNFTSQFTTMPTDSSGAGSVVSTRPGTGSSGIGVNSPIVLYTNLPINPASANAGLQVAQNNVALQGSVQVLDNGYTLEFTPSSAWTPGALIQWWTTASLTDAAYGNSFNAASGYFYVVADTSTLTPTVQVMSPPDGSYAAPNSFVDVQFNTPLNPSTVNSSNIYLYDNYAGLNVSVTYSMPQPNVVRMVPSGNLNANDYIMLLVTTGLTSTTSVPATSVGMWTDYFYTGSPVDTKLPTVTNAVPYNGATNVGVNVTPGVVFNKAIDPVSVNSNTFQVTQAGTSLPGSFWISSDDTRVEFVPNAPLPASTNLTMSLNGVLDPVGNPLNFTSNFTTAAGPDVTAPTIVYTSVGSNESIPINSSITVQFSESMDVTTFNSGNFFIQDTLLNQQVPATLSWSSDQSVAYLVPSAPLAAGREYYLYVAGGSDLAGNEMTGSYYSSYTYFYADFTGASTAPTVVKLNPLSGATGLGTNVFIEAQFSAPVDPNTLTGVTLTASGAPVLTSPSLSAGNTVLQVQPQTPLAPNTTYQLTIAGVKDPAGNQVATVTDSFTTGATFDINPPAVVSYDPPNYSTVGTNVVPKLVFSKPLNPVTVSNSTFNMYLNDTEQWIPLTVTLSANAMEVTLQPQIPLLPNTLYEFGACCGYQDQDGNNGAGFNLYFYTGSGAVAAGPTVTVSPTPGAMGIPLNAQVLVTASAAIDPTSWSQTSITLLDSGNNPVAGTVTMTTNQTLTFVPTNSLSPDMTFTINVNGFTDANGNAVVPSSTTFTTGAIAGTGGLNLTSINIPLGSTNVSATAQIVLTFSQILDPTTVNSSTLPVMNAWAGLTLAGTYAISGNTVTFTPASPYPAGSTVYVGECGGPTDVLGDVFYGGSCWPQQLTYFTVTTATPDTTPLTVVAVNPANGAANVRHDLPVSVTFNKSINPGTVSSYNPSTGTTVYNAQLYAGQDLQTNGSVTMSADNRTMTFNSGALHDATTYTITLPAGGITDMSGNALAANFLSTFTTATNPATGAGSVTAVNPSWNSTGVPTDTLLTLYVNRPVNAATLPGNLTVTVNGQVYGGTVASTASGYEVQFTPGTPFPNGAVVQWFFSANVLDVNGNAFSANSGYFYTVAAVNPATASPQIVAISPASGTGMMPTNGEVDIEFSLPIDPTTLIGNVFMYDATVGTNLPTTITQPSPNIVRLTPNSLLNPVSPYYLCASNGSVLGTNGVAAQTDCYWADYITTSSGPDTNSGTVKIGPPNGVVNIGTNAFIRFQFSKPVDITTVNATTVQVTSGGNPIPGTWTYNYSGADVLGANFYPVNPLPPSSAIQVNVNGLLDYAGNTFSPASSTFTTGPLPDFTSAYAYQDFSYGQTGVATNASFTCRYTKPMDPSSITPSGVYVYSYVTNASIPVAYTFSSDLMAVTMTPTTPLFADSQYYYACGGAIDLTGNAQSSYYWWSSDDVFYTGNGPSSAGPTLLYANPPNGMTNVPLNSNNGPWAGTSLGLLFNEPVAADSLSNITLTPAGGSPIPLTAYPENGDTIVALQLPYVLQPNIAYTFNVTGVTDYNGNPMTPVTSTFTTGSSFDWTNPTVIATNPANGAPSVDVNTQALSVTFSEAMDPVLINSGNVYLQLHNTATPVPATITFSPDYTTAILTPATPLAESTIYDLVYWPNNWYLTDIAGNPSYSYGVFSTFTTNTTTALNGACGSANGQSFSAAPAANLCSAGTASAITNPGSWTWTCNGQYGGTNASCSANVTLLNAPVAQPAGLVSWWPGNDNANDIIGGNNGTLENGASFALGEVGDAFSLNGADQYVLIGEPVPANLQIQNAITLSAWIYVTGYPAGGAIQAIVGSEDDATVGGASIYLDGRTNPEGLSGVPLGHIEFALGDGSTGYAAETTTQVPLNQWTLITAAQTANNPAQIYYNGVRQPSVTLGTVWNGTILYTGTWFAIGEAPIDSSPFTGLIDEVQVYNTALTANQVLGIYNAGSSGMTPP